MDIADGHLSRSISYLSTREDCEISLKRAAEIYKEIIELDSGISPAFIGGGIALMNLGILDEALDLLQEATEINFENIESHIIMGIIYQKRGENDKAVASFTKAIKLNPISKDEEYAAFNDRGSSYEQLNELDKSLEDYSHAIEVDPERLEAYANRGYVYNQKGEYRKAIDDLLRAIEIDSNYIIAHAHLGDTYIGLRIEMQNQSIEGSEIMFNQAKIRYEKALDLIRAVPLELRKDEQYLGAIRAEKGLDFLGIPTLTFYTEEALNLDILTQEIIDRSTKQTFQ